MKEKRREERLDLGKKVKEIREIMRVLEEREWKAREKEVEVQLGQEELARQERDWEEWKGAKEKERKAIESML